MDDPCACGDVRDEHEDGRGACLIFGCPCVAFELEAEEDYDPGPGYREYIEPDLF